MVFFPNRMSYFRIFGNLFFKTLCGQTFRNQQKRNGSTFYIPSGALNISRETPNSACAVIMCKCTIILLQLNTMQGMYTLGSAHKLRNYFSSCKSITFSAHNTETTIYRVYNIIILLNSYYCFVEPEVMGFRR